MYVFVCEDVYVSVYEVLDTCVHGCTTIAFFKAIGYCSKSARKIPGSGRR